jgi:hypothetical protein
MAAVPDGAAVLAICHGGGIEPALVNSLPHADHDSWSWPFGHCRRTPTGQFRRHRLSSSTRHRQADEIHADVLGRG